MSDTTSLADILEDDAFPAIDVALRRGEHIDHESDRDRHLFLERHQDILRHFYRAYHAELVDDPDGYWVLIPESSSPLRVRQMNRAEMLAGLTLAKMRLDPAILASAMTITREQMLAEMDSLFGGHEKIEGILGKGRRSRGASNAQAKIRKAIASAILSLTRLGFVTLDGDDRLVLHASLGRFIDIARDRDPAVALDSVIRRCRGMAGLPETDEDTDADEDAP